MKIVKHNVPDVGKNTELLFQVLESTGGSVTLLCETTEDLWCLSRLVMPNNVVIMADKRKVYNADTGKSLDKRETIKMHLRVVTTEYNSGDAELRISGVSTVTNDYMKAGQAHSLSVSVNKQLSIAKFPWSRVELDVIARCTDISKRAELSAVIISEDQAIICLIDGEVTSVRARIEANIPCKTRFNEEKRAKAYTKYFDEVTKAILAIVDFSLVRCVIVASPGPTNNRLLKHFFSLPEIAGDETVKKNKHKFIPVPVSSGNRRALREALLDPRVSKLVEDTKYAKELLSLEKFKKSLVKDYTMVTYGYTHVKEALDAHAADVVLLTDELTMSKDTDERLKYADLIKTAQESDIEVSILSSAHDSGRELMMYTGIIAILRYPMTFEDQEHGGDEENSDRSADSSVIDYFS